MRRCLQEKIFCDYSSFRNEKPGKILCNDYVAKRKSALADLKTQHNLFNVSIQYSANLAKSTCNYAIYRFHPKFAGAKKHFFHSYGQYSFELKRNRRQWKISSITQTLLVNEGNPELHGATRKGIKKEADPL